MNICVLNGSPKGENSITLQTVNYLKNCYPKHQFEILHVGRKIKRYEKNMEEAKQAMEQADLILFCYPVYTFIAPYQLHRFIELVKEQEVKLSGKYVAQLTTSKHFYDVTAHQYIKENCLDLGMFYLAGLSADMEDLLHAQGRKDAREFFQYAIYSAVHGIYEAAPEMRSEQTTSAKANDYKAALEMRNEQTTLIEARNQTELEIRHQGRSLSKGQISEAPSESAAHVKEVNQHGGYDTVIVTNLEPGDTALAEMIEEFRAVYPNPTRVINIHTYPFAGGCLGCFHCAGDGKCIYKDGFDTFLREEIQTADAIVYAFTIQDHSMGASFKCYDDRQFCNGHRTVTIGMPMGYIVQGDLEREANLQLILRGRSEVGHNFHAGEATDSAGIKRLSARLSYALEHKLLFPQNFLGVGGMKIFRDLIYLMQGLMKEDHRFYKEHGFYDFPQKKVGTIWKMKLLGGLVTNPKIKAKLGNKMTEGMLAPYKKAIDKAKKCKA